MGRALGAVPSLLCRDCPYWYGAEDDGYGPCTIKSQRGETRPLTYGAHECDEGYDMVSGQIVYLGVAKPKAALAAKPALKPAMTAKRARVVKPSRPNSAAKKARKSARRGK